MTNPYEGFTPRQEFYGQLNAHFERFKTMALEAAGEPLDTHVESIDFEEVMVPLTLEGEGDAPRTDYAATYNFINAPGEGPNVFYTVQTDLHDPSSRYPVLLPADEERTEELVAAWNRANFSDGVPRDIDPILLNGYFLMSAAEMPPLVVNTNFFNATEGTDDLERVQQVREAGVTQDLSDADCLSVLSAFPHLRPNLELFRDRLEE